MPSLDTKLATLRQRLFDVRAMQSNGTADNARATRSLNRALMRMADEIPTAFVPDDEHVVIYPQYTSADVSLRLQVDSTDARVLVFSTTSGATAFLSAIVGQFRPKVDGTWDGIMHLEVTDPDGVVHRRQSREWWVVNNGGGPPTFTYYVSLDRPWKNTTDTLMDFRIYQPEFFLRADAKNVLGAPRLFGENRQTLGSLTWRGARTWAVEPDADGGINEPEAYWQTRHFQIPAPTEAPTVAVDPAVPSTEPWVGPWQEGTFDFIYTYCWGTRDAEWQSSVTGIRDPQWESAPSPPTTFSHTVSSGLGIRVSAPALDQEYGWYDTAGSGLIHGRGGFYVRVYGRRTAVRAAGAGSINDAETSNRFYLLGQFDPLTSTTGYLLWTGTTPLDHSRPLAYSSGYYGYGYSPNADKRYEVDVQISRAVEELIDDQDVAPIRAGRPAEALLELAAHYHALQDGVDQSSAERHLVRYKDLIRETRSQQDPVDSIMPAGYRRSSQRRSWRYTSS